MRKDFLQKLQECSECYLAKLPPYRTRSAEKFAQHMRDHGNGAIKFTCSACFSQVSANFVSRANHARMCVPAAAAGRNNGGRGHRKRQRNDNNNDDDDFAACPNCGDTMAGRSRNAIFDHINQCRGSDRALPGRDEDDGEILMELERDEDDGEILMELEHGDGIDFRATDTGPAPPWERDKFLFDRSVCDERFEILEDCDKMLLYALEAGGVRLSDAAWEILYRVLNSRQFAQAFADGKISKSYKKIRDFEKEACEKMWKEVTFKDSVLHVRDLRDVVDDMLKDPSLLENADFERRDTVGIGQDLVYGDRFTMFGTYQQRVAHVHERFGQQVRLLSLGLWLDEAEIDQNGNPIYVMALFLLNAPSSLLRRTDCIFPVAYTYTQSNIVDAMRYLLPQFEALRESVRIWRDKRLYVAEVHLVTADNPAVTKLMMVMKSSAARIPCKNCFIRNAPSDGQLLNDPSRWVDQELRSQTISQQQVVAMRHRQLTGMETGMGDENVYRSNPLFLYCEHFIRDSGGMLDAFSLRAGDLMHDLFLGLVKEVSGAMADIVLKSGEAAIEKFKSACVTFSLANVRGFNMTIRRPKDTKKTCKTTFLHLLSNRSCLYAREYQEALPLLPILFHAAEVETIDRALPPFCDLMVFCTFLQSREWPLNAPDEWWAERRDFGIRSYSEIQAVLLRHSQLEKEKQFVKIHNLLTHHLTESVRRHGNFCGTQGLEGLFGAYKKLSTNKKLMGSQIMRKMLRSVDAGNYFAGNSMDSRSLNIIVNGDGSKHRKAGTVATSAVGEDVRLAVVQYCSENGFDVNEGAFVKWIECADRDTDDGGADRGVKKAYACPKWYGKEKCDTIEIVKDGFTTYCRLKALFQLRSGEVIAVGTELQQCARPPYSYGMPVLRYVKGRHLTAFALEKDSISVCQLFPALRRLDEEFRMVWHRDGWPAYSATDSIFHHNIFCTYGEMRYWDEKRWLTGK